MNVKKDNSVIYSFLKICIGLIIVLGLMLIGQGVINKKAHTLHSIYHRSDGTTIKMIEFNDSKMFLYNYDSGKLTGKWNFTYKKEKNKVYITNTQDLKTDTWTIKNDKLIANILTEHDGFQTVNYEAITKAEINKKISND